MKILLLYITLAFFVSNVFSQHVDGDTFLPDMGVVIQSADKSSKPEPPLEKNHIVKLNNMTNKKESNFVFTATASDMISSIDRITSHVSNIEKDYQSKIEQLEVENSNLRNKIIWVPRQYN